MNKLNPAYMIDIFKLRNTDNYFMKKCKLNLELPKANQPSLEQDASFVMAQKYWMSYPNV